MRCFCTTVPTTRISVCSRLYFSFINFSFLALGIGDAWGIKIKIIIIIVSNNAVEYLTLRPFVKFDGNLF